MTEAPLPTTLTAILAEGYAAFVLQRGDRETVTRRAKEALESNPALKAEAGRELVRLDELAKKSSGQLERRCFVSAKNMQFLKLILGA